jgi:hypothetical protein
MTLSLRDFEFIKHEKKLNEVTTFPSAHRKRQRLDNDILRLGGGVNNIFNFKRIFYLHF